MIERRTQVVLSLLKKYLEQNEAEQLLIPIMQGIPVLIDGKQGPTGKTTLYEGLKEMGIAVAERWMLNEHYGNVPDVFRSSNKNAVFITITLNERTRI